MHKEINLTTGIRNKSYYALGKFMESKLNPSKRLKNTYTQLPIYSCMLSVWMGHYWSVTKENKNKIMVYEIKRVLC